LDLKGYSLFFEPNAAFMYNLPHHKAKDEADILEFIARYPFAFLTGCDVAGKPVATQLPVFIEEVDGKRVLRGHMMKGNDHHKAFLQNENVLVVFTGHHTYVSGTWYSNPHTPSTWNYMSVHARGMIRFPDDEALISILRKITLHFENNNAQSATTYDNLSPELTKRLMHMIVAFEIEITELDTVFKLSQDRDEQSYDNIIVQLRNQGESGQVIAAEMVKRKDDVFKKGH
jgi:transcriptional regulator